MTLRRQAPRTLLLLVPSLLWAGVAEAGPPAEAEGPPVQRPSATTTEVPETAAPETAPETTVPGAGPETAPSEIPASEAPEVAPSEGPEPAAAPSPEPAASPSPEPAADEPDLSNLLVSDEPDRPEPRVRVASDDRDRVDRSERLRNYYARIYRPEHNPSRIHFMARGAYALAGAGGGERGGGRMGFANVELGQTWNFISYGIGASLFAGGMTFGDEGVEKFAPILVGGGPSLGLGRLGLFGRGYLDLRAGYNFFYAPVSSTRPELSDPPDAAPHGPKVQIDVGLLLHDSERRRFRHGLGATIGWQMLVHSLAGDYPLVNSFMVGFGYFFG